MQLTAIRTEVRRLLGVSETDPFYSDAKVTAFINSVHRRQSARKPWPWLEVQVTLNTVVGQQAYALPTNHRTTLELTVPGRALALYNRKEHARLSEANGTPAVYTIRNNAIHLMPTPVAVEAVTHLYIRSPATLVSGTDVPELPSPFIDWLVTETAIQFSVAVGESERIDALERIAVRWWDSIQDEVRQSRGSTRRLGRRDW